jgi:riboflavin synthase alpha subunit
MFTGLIEAVGHIEEAQAVATAVRLRVSTALAAEMRPGDSLALNGVCLTVAVVEAGEVTADVGPETLRVTTLGSMRSRQLVNLERAMRADARFGGHFVQGHVDGTGVVKAIRAEGETHWLTVSFEKALAAYCVPKGSVAVDGMSLTVAALRDHEFDVMIIPFTWENVSADSLALPDMNRI